MNIIKQCIDYVMHTPYNTNPTVLKDFLMKIYTSQVDNIILNVDYSDGNLYATWPDTANIGFSLEDGVLYYSH